MNILIIGSGGREHALAWKISQSPLCDKLFIAPGNAGTSGCGINLDIKATDFSGIRQAVFQNDIRMVVVGPEDPLVKGIYDFFKSDTALQNVHLIGPSAAAAELEGSKAFAKKFMKKYQIPTAEYREFDAENYQEGIEYLSVHTLPVVLKADGLAAGKGVLICQSNDEALEEFEKMILQSKFGEAGKKVVVESFLKGIEMSVFVLTDGKDYCLLPEAKDYKRIGEGDTGLNTGGMGAVSPLPFFDETLRKKIIDRIIDPTVKGIFAEQLPYTGFIFFGLMIDNGEPFVIEYNCRMGDPETEVVIPRIQSDLVELLEAAATGKLHAAQVVTDSRTALTTVAVSGGYPGDYETNKLIEGLADVVAPQTIVFHSGTKASADGVFTNGGRVLALTAFGENMQEAYENSMAALSSIHFENCYFRKDIGYEFRG